MSRVYKPVRVGAMGDCRCRYGMRVCKPHSTCTCNMGLMGLPAFPGQCDRVTHGHAIPLAWFSPTTTSPISLPTAANRPHMPLPSPEGCGLACSYSIRGYGRKNTRGDPASGRPSWCVARTGHLMARSCSFLFPVPQLMPLPPPAMLAALT
jgi:hypothetical protein